MIYGLIALHLPAIAFREFIRRERPVKPMITGRKQVESRHPHGALLSPPPPPPPDLGWQG